MLRIGLVAASSADCPSTARAPLHPCAYGGATTGETDRTPGNATSRGTESIEHRQLFRLAVVLVDGQRQFAH